MNTNTGRSYCTIQAAIDDPLTVNGHTITASAGTYAENVTVNKSVTLLGASVDLACGSREAESVIAPASGTPVTITASGVTLNGFEITAPSATYGIVCGNTSNTSIVFNNIHDIGTLVTNANVHAINYTVSNAPAATSNITIADNCFNDISSALLTGKSASAIGILQSPSTGTLTGLNILRNFINNVNVNTGTWPTGKIAYGMQINVGGSGSYTTTTGKVVNAVIRDNEFSNIKGFIATGIALEGNTENADVENNIVSNLTGYKLGDRSGGGYDLNGLKFENNRYVSTCTVKNNSFRTNTFTHNATAGLGYAVANYVPVADGGTATLECNWFGTAVYNEIMDNALLTGKIFNKDLCQTNFVPYRSNGVDANPLVIGFQPTGACAAPCALTLSTTSTAATCPLMNNGTATVNVVGGGTGPYTYSWNTVPVQSTATATGLVAGNYTATVIDINGCSATQSVLVANSLAGPVHNLNTGLNYCSIQAAIDDPLTVNGHVISIDDGTYNERVTLTKSLTIEGESETGVVLNGSGLGGTGKGIRINTGITGVTVKRLTVQNFAGAGGNTDAGIYAVGGNNNLKVEHVTIQNNVGGSGFYANGPIDNVIINYVTSSGHTVGARGIVIWNGLKSNITITNCEVFNNNCCGIELQDGSGTGVFVGSNNVHDNGDNGIGLVGLTGPGANLISANSVANNGRFGIEIKNPNGSGAAAGPGSVVVFGNTVSRTVPIGAESRDLAGIAVFRRGVLPGNVDVPAGVVVSSNAVSGFVQPSVSEGFGIVMEGINHTVTGNTVTGNDVGIQRQAGHLPYPGDGNQNNLADTYFGRGNSPFTCGVALSGNILANTTDTRDVGNSSGTGIVTNTNTGRSYCSIQAAIDDPLTMNGHTITASAGIYAENIVVSKSLSILGPNSAIDPCTGVRGPEAIVVPAISGIDYLEIFHVAASDVTISGFTIDGDNPAINTGYTSTNGADIDAAEGITVYETGINNLTAVNNIIQNLSYFGLTLYDYPAGVASTGHVISNNKIQDMGTYDGASGIPYWGGGVLLYNNQYAAVSNNCMNNVRIGVQTGNYYRANPGAPAFQVIDNNTMTNVRRLGIFHNLQYSAASPYTLSGNSVTGVSNVNETKWDGITLFSLSVPSSAVGNTVDASAVAQTSSGYNVWNVKNTSPASISGGSVSGTSRGVFVNNYDGYNSNAGDGAHATVSGIVISPSATGTGIRIFDNPLSTHANVQATLGAGIVINNGTNGLVVENASASVTSLGNVAFNGQSDKYIHLISNANAINATTATFGGNTGGTATLAQNFAIEDKITHAQDNASLGFVTVKAGEDFVTPISGSIQRGVNNASNGWIVNVAAGTYNENVVINKSLTLNGANSNVTCSGSRGSESVINGILGSNSAAVSIEADGVTLNGFKITNPLGSFGVFAKGRNNTDVQYNIVDDIGNSVSGQFPSYGIYMLRGSAAHTTNVNFSNNCVTNIRGGENTSLTGAAAKANNGSAAGIGAGDSEANFDIIGLTINRNIIENITACISAFADGGKGTYGVIINVGAKAAFTGKAVNPLVTNNEIKDLEGLWAHGVGLEGETPGAMVLNNIINGLTDHKGNTDAIGVLLESNDGAATVQIHENSFTNMVYGVVNLMPPAVNATCNWYGTNSAAGVAAKNAGAVIYGPWLSDGTDGSTAIGFQPTASCNAVPATALHFDGVNDYVNAGNQPGLKFTTSSFTLQASVFPTGAGSPADGGIILNKEGEYEFARYPDGSLRYAFANTIPGWNWINTGIILPLNTWTDITVIYDRANSQIKIYTNGLAQSYTGTFTGDIGDAHPAQNEFWIGGRQAVTQFFQGAIDEVRVWNRALCTVEITSYKNCELVGSLPGLVANYKLNNGLVGGNNTGLTNAADASVSGYHATLNNFALVGATSNWTAGTVTGTCGAVYVPAGITCPGNIITTTDPNLCTKLVTYTTTITGSPVPTVSYELSGATTAGPTAGNGSGAVFNKGVTTVKITVTNGCGNTYCSFMVMVNDGQAPVLDPAPAAVTVQCVGDVPAMTSLAWTDNCDAGGLVNGVDGPLVGGACGGTITRSWSVSDAAGNAAITRTQIITVKDDTKPVITRLGSAIVQVCLNATYTDAGATAMDNCDGNITANIVTNNPVSTSIPGTYTVTYNVIDACGNPAAQITRTVVVNARPIFGFSAKSSGGSVQSGNNSGGPVTITVDFCSGENLILNGLTRSPNSVGFIEKLISSGNVLYNGGTVPGNRPQTFILPLAAPGFFNTTYGPYTLATGISGTITQTYTPFYDINNNNAYDAGIDCLGDVITLQYNIYQRPNAAATNKSICSGAATALAVTNPNGVTGSLFNWTATYGAVTGGSGSANGIAFGANAINETLFNATASPVNVVYTITPIGPAPRNCPGTPISVTLTVNPLTPCSISGASTVCPASAGNIYSATPGMSSYSWSITGNGNIVGSTTSQAVSVTAGNVCNQTYTLTLAITDVNGCQSTCQKTVNVIDNTAPTFTPPADITILFSSPGVYDASPAVTGNPTSVSDNCDASPLVSYSDGVGPVQCGNNLVITRTWTVKDACNNASNQVQTITVTDNNTSYIIYATKEAKFGEDNIIHGDVGVTDANGKAEFKKNDVLDPFTVTAKNINVQLPSAVNNRVYSPATGGPNPPMQLYVANPLSGNHNQTSNGVVPAGDFKHLTIKKGVTATINGSNYGKITIEEGAQVTFTSADINVEELSVGKGKKLGTTNVYFTNSAAVKVKDKVNIEEDTRVNVGGPIVTFYLGDNMKDEEKFTIKGDDVQVTANIMIPNGKLKIEKKSDDCIMTGWYIIEKLESIGGVTWNMYDCAPPFAALGQPVVNTQQAPVETPSVVVNSEVKLPVFEVRAYPNPSSTHFSIVVNSLSSEPITVRVMDVSGNVLSVITKVSKGSVVSLGNDLRSGTYMAEVTQGANRKLVKLVKLN